jgi:MFS family permease
MFERFKRSHNGDGAAERRSGAVATAERPSGGGADDPVAHDDRGIRRDSAAGNRAATGARPARTGNGTTSRSALATARARQREEFGGVNWGASFFGWLVAVGVAALLTALLAAAGAAIGLTATTESEVTSNAEELSVGGGIALVVVLMLAYYAGGYVAGRMSRFDGARQGLGTWLIGLIVTIGLAIAAVVLGDEYNVLEQLNLPSLPVGDQTLATGGVVALAAIVLGTLLAAMFGGKVGERYHKRVDRAGFVD